MKLLIAMVLCCISSASWADDSLTIFVNTQPQSITIYDTTTAIITPGVNSAETELLENPGFDLAQPPLEYTEEVDNTFQIIMLSGADISLQMRYAAGDTPAEFTPGKWPTAELRSAESPSGVVLATYTTEIINESNAEWALRLTHDQTATLSGRIGVTELKMPDAEGNYYIWQRIPTIIKGHVTE